MKELLKCRIQKIALILMILLFVTLAVPALAASVEAATVRSAPLSVDSAIHNGMVRVYLSSLGNPSRLDLTVQGNYSLSHNGQFLSNGQRLTVSFDSSTGIISLSLNGNQLNMGKQFSLRRHSASGSNGILISQSRENQNPYPGDLSFQAVSNGNGYTMYVIAHVFMEDYLYGVVPYEMGNSNNIEALKAQAVAARTYAVRMMKTRASGLYDVKDTTSDQSYRGTPSGNANCKAAVDATKGIVLMYGSDYITTYYSASNGGQTEKARTGNTYAYMKVKDDPFDYANTSSTVKSKTLYADLSSASNPAQLISLLRTKAISKLNQTGYAANSSNTVLKNLQSITPHTPMYASPSRVYTKMDFTLTVSTQNAMGQSVTVTQTVTCDIFDELESLLSMSIQSLDNELWTVVKKNGSFTLQARRYGHGMGMSQRGAMQMAKLGYTYDEILGFYYDGCKRVRHSFNNTVLSPSSSEQQITVETPAELGNEDENSCKGTVRLASAGAVLAIRNAASSDGKVIGTAGNGAIVTVLGASGDWMLVRYGEITGYVLAASLSISGTPENTQESVSSIAGFATVTANDYVNLRASGSMNASILGTAPTGSVLTVLSVNGSWAKVQFNALAAYVNTNYISSVMSSYPSSNLSSGTQTATVVTHDETTTVNLRKTPSMQAELVNRLSVGTVVTVLSDDGSWSQVVCSAGEGYILSEFLQASEEAGPPAETVPGTEEEIEQEIQTAVVATEYGSLNLRAEARAGSRILTTIPKGMTVRVTLYGSVWTAVEYNGYTGYVMTSYLSGSSLQKPETEISDCKAMVVTPSGTLNLRSLPRTGSDILTRIPPGTVLDVFEKGTEWCQVTYEGWGGYVMTTFLSFLPEEGTKQPPEDENKETSGEEENQGTGTEEEPNEGGEKPSSGEGQEEENILTATVQTVSGSLNLRSSPTRYGEIITTVPQNGVVEVEQKSDEWCFVCYQGIYGYVMTNYLRFEEESENTGSGAAESQMEKAWVNTVSGSLNMRLYPVDGAEIVTTVPKDAEVSVASHDALWCAIAFGPYTGYVKTEYLRFEKTQTQIPPETTEPSDTGSYNEETAVKAWVNTLSGSLNVRQAPDRNAVCILQIPKNAQVLILEEGGEWSYVCYDTVYGYVMTQYLSAIQPSEKQETTGESSSGEPSSGESSSEERMDETMKKPDGMLFAVLKEDASLWPACEEKGESEDILTAETQVQILLLGDEWCQIGYETKQGYCLREKLSVIE